MPFPGCLEGWVVELGPDPTEYGTHSMGPKSDDLLFPSRIHHSPNLGSVSMRKSDSPRGDLVAMADVAYFERNEIASAKLAVDAQVEGSELAYSVRYLKTMGLPTS